jgi:DNA-binding response OmpR family regulator
MKILIVEDEAKLAVALRRGLELDGYAVDAIADGLKASVRLAQRGDEYDLVVLDVRLPGKDGFAVAREVRRRGDRVPIIMLTARDTVQDRVEGLDSGADDYLVKPFAFAELQARIRALLRRPAALVPAVLTAGALELDPGARAVRIAGGTLDLTAKELALLHYFMRHPGQVLDRERLYAHVWDEESDVYSNVVDVHIKNLRKKLATAPGGPRIATVRGAGYVLQI